ncbi:MAG TPA: hypothetical protein VLV55_05120 [Rhizomicrobium sp.]|nr:hypothetical protein [Rhizomicrobium sp.]
MAHNDNIQAIDDLVVRAALFREEAAMLAARASRARDQIVRSAYSDLASRWLMFAAQLELEAAEHFAEQGGRQEARDRSGLSCAPWPVNHTDSCALKLV